MKLGITASTLNPSGYGRWGNATYQKLKEHGYSASDFDMANTDSVLYTLPRKEAETILLHEKNLAQEAGIEITQVHGPWRYPPQDSTEEDRAERMEKMKESIRMTAILGCKNWVIHPLMPFGMDDIGTEMISTFLLCGNCWKQPRQAMLPSVWRICPCRNSLFPRPLIYCSLLE